eukprot:7668262-Prorocentrum_lima.AAC.1
MAELVPSDTEIIPDDDEENLPEAPRQDIEARRWPGPQMRRLVEEPPHGSHPAPAAKATPIHCQ